MNQIYKICDIYSNGKVSGSIFSTEPDEKWDDGFSLRIKVADKISIKYGHIQYSDIYNPLTLTKTQIESFKKLIELWKKRRLSYAKWHEFGASYIGHIGYYYSKPYSEVDVRIEKQNKPKDKIIIKKEQIEDFNKSKEIFVNKELTSEVFNWEGYTVEFFRHRIGIKGKNQGLIIPFDEIKNLSELFKVC